ncbi:hypothetical protein MKW92_003938 [Papaver armeniacum]|nr:hypothetical protein MKW92_003938 [Papaver armeniacum]
MSTLSSLNSLIPLKNQFQFPAISINRIRANHVRISASLNNNNSEETNLNLSVLRFTLGIPGLDESYLPRWIGYTFGSLIVLNHFVGSNSYTSSSQLRSEALGLCLAAFSITIPYVGKFLKGAAPVERPALPEGNKQIFAMSESLSERDREDLAWGTFVLLKNTNTVSVLISAKGALCVRGYWNSPESASKAQILEWLERQIQQIGLSDLKETLYFPQGADSAVWEMLPEGIYPFPSSTTSARRS